MVVSTRLAAMELGQTLYVSNRKAWRSWLKKHYNTKKEIWLIYTKKFSSKPRIPYNDAVEEALCYGWIDSTLKPIDKEKYAQRFSPRRPGSKLSDMNKERIRRLIKQKIMTPAGMAAVSHVPNITSINLVIAPDIVRAIKKDKNTWNNFQKFPASYKRIRIGWIEMARAHRQVFNQRLRYFIKMTAQNKRFGMVQ
jgi:uncharacterized protein YdeI (YjbR/CyaY-like superfamily)